MKQTRLVPAIAVAFLAGAVLTLVLVDRVLRFDSQALTTGVTLAATIATTAATVALASFAAVQVSVERQRRDSEQRSADARLSANAFELREGLGGLILQEQREGWTKSWVEQVLNQTPISDRLERGLADAAQASPVIADLWRGAYLRYQRAVISLEAVRANWTDHPFSPAEAQQLTGAREDMRACCRDLECVVDPLLMAEAKRIGVLPEGV